MYQVVKIGPIGALRFPDLIVDLLACPLPSLDRSHYIDFAMCRCPASAMQPPGSGMPAVVGRSPGVRWHPCLLSATSTPTLLLEHGR